MEGYKKERSSRQYMRIDVAGGQESGLLLANPMTCGDISPGNGSSTAVSNGTVLGRTSERGSVRKSRPKSPSLLRFFVRGSTRKSSADEEDYASSGSDHDDPFSPRGNSSTQFPDVVHTNRFTEAPRASSSSIADHFATLPRKPRRYHTHRDSGVSSERESVSQRDDGTTLAFQTTEEVRTAVSPVEEYRSGGMEALEMLHNQLQILVKQDCGQEVWGDEGMVEEQVIASLQHQLEDMQHSLECLQQSDHNLRLSLRLAEHRAMETETKLSHAIDRCQRTEQRYLLLGCKYQALARRHRELEKHQQKQSVLQQLERSRVAMSQNALNRTSQLSRVQSQREFDLSGADRDVFKRPSSAQAMHEPSLSHTETCV